MGFSPISGTDSTSLSGIRASWDASGAYTISYSTDNITFTNLTSNGQLIPGTVGLDTTGLTLFIKVAFTGGIANDISQVRDITLTSYSTPNVYGSDQSRALVLTGAVSTALERHEPIERHSNAGLTMYGGYATLGADVSAVPSDLAAIEFWIKPTSLSANAELYDARPTYGYIMYNSGGNLTYTGHSAVYINGVLTASNIMAPTVGEWMHILYVPTAQYNVAAIIGQKYTFVEPFLGQIGMIASYRVAPTSTQALALYKSYMQNPTAQAIDTAGVTLTELSTAYTNYSLNWTAITASV
jgi:hypothetical protein